MRFATTFRARRPGGNCPAFPEWLELAEIKGYAASYIVKEEGYWVAKVVSAVTPAARMKIESADWFEVVK